MATKFFLATTTESASLFADSRDLTLTAGSGLEVQDEATAAGPIPACNSLFINSATGDIAWISAPLNAVTISGTITINLWMSESAMAANVGPQIGIFVVDNGITTYGAHLLGCVQGATPAGTTYEKGTELPVTTRAVQNWTGTPDSVSVVAGERIAVQVQGNDVGTMAAGHTFDLGFGGTTGGSDGDSWIQFTETITEQAAAALPPRPEVGNFALPRSFSY